MLSMVDKSSEDEKPATVPEDFSLKNEDSPGPILKFDFSKYNWYT